MLVSLMPVVNAQGREILILKDLDLSDRSEYDAKFLKPVKFYGKISNIAGSLQISGQVRAEISFMCDRCGEWYDFVLNFEIFEILKKESDREPEDEKNLDVVFYTGSCIDVASIVYNNLYMNFPTKKLCKNNCKGLCSVCGSNLNEKECTCGVETTDPRFDVLDNFFDK